MKKIKENKFLLILILFGIIIFGFVANMLLSSNKKVKAIVPAGTIEASTTITSEMIKVIEVDADTPGNFIRNESSIIGSKTKNTLQENQLLYESDFMSSWTDYTEMETVDEDFIITTLQVPDDRACGGIITAGDYVDVLLVDHAGEDVDASNETSIANTWLNNTNTNANFVLANVLVLTTNSALSASQENDMSTLQENSKNSSSDEGSFYVVALCYNDYMKLRIADSTKNSEIWLNLCPAQNTNNPPMINQMASKKFAYLHDAQENVMDKDGNMLVDEYYETDENGIIVDNSDERLNESLFNDKSENDEDSEELEEGENQENDEENSDEGQNETKTENKKSTE